MKRHHWLICSHCQTEMCYLDPYAGICETCGAVGLLRPVEGMPAEYSNWNACCPAWLGRHQAAGRSPRTAEIMSRPLDSHTSGANMRRTPGSLSHRGPGSCPSWARTRTLLIQSSTHRYSIGHSPAVEASNDAPHRPRTTGTDIASPVLSPVSRGTSVRGVS